MRKAAEESLILPLDAAQEQMLLAKPASAPRTYRAAVRSLRFLHTIAAGTVWSLRPPPPCRLAAREEPCPMVLPVSFILGNGGSGIAGKCQPSLGNTSRGCVSPRIQTSWRLLVFHQVSERRIGPVRMYLRVYVRVPFLLQVRGKQRVWVLVCVGVGSSAGAVWQLECQRRALQHQPWLPFCLLSHWEGGKM